MQQIKGIGCFACSHNNVPDQVKEKERGRVKMRALSIFAWLQASLYITWGNGLPSEKLPQAGKHGLVLPKLQGWGDAG